MKGLKSSRAKTLYIILAQYPYHCILFRFEIENSTIRKYTAKRTSRSLWELESKKIPAYISELLLYLRNVLSWFYVHNYLVKWSYCCSDNLLSLHICAACHWKYKSWDAVTKAEIRANLLFSNLPSSQFSELKKTMLLNTQLSFQNN